MVDSTQDVTIQLKFSDVTIMDKLAICIHYVLIWISERIGSFFKVLFIRECLCERKTTKYHAHDKLY